MGMGLISSKLASHISAAPAPRLTSADAQNHLRVLNLVSADGVGLIAFRIVERVHRVHHGSGKHFSCNVPYCCACDLRCDLGYAIRIEIDDRE